MFIAISHLGLSAPAGAACKLKQPKHIAPLWSAGQLTCDAINIVLPPEHLSRVFTAQTTGLTFLAMTPGESVLTPTGAE